MKRNVYFASGCAVLLAIGILAIWGFLQASGLKLRASGSTDDEIQTVAHGRVLLVVVEKEAVYVGEEKISFSSFEDYLKSQARVLQPNYAIVSGTDLARYGDVVKVYDAIRRVLQISATIHTEPVIVGTRQGPIEVMRYPWEYVKIHVRSSTAVLSGKKSP